MGWNKAQKQPPPFLQALRELAQTLRDRADEMDRQTEKTIRKMAEMVAEKTKGDRDGME